MTTVKLEVDQPKSSEITPKSLYLDRRRFLVAAAGFGAVALSAERLSELFSPAVSALAGNSLQAHKSPISTTGEKLTPRAAFIRSPGRCRSTGWSTSLKRLTMIPC